MKKEKRKMWQFPWQYKESIALVSGIVIIGFVLQLTIGEFNFFLLQSPVNIILGAALVLFLILFSFARKTAFYQWFSGVSFSVTIIGALLVLSLVMGLTPQVVKVGPHDHDIFTLLGFRKVTTSWSFVLVYFLTLLSLGTLIVRRLIAFRKQDYAFYFNHIGLWVFLFAAGMGAADMKRYVMHITEGEVEWRVYNENGDVLDLPIAIQLNDFDMEVYPPKLAIIDRETGVPQPENKPDYYQIEEKRPEGVLTDWDIKVEEYIHYAVRNSDSTYHEVHMPGSSPAALISAKNRINGDLQKGWVCSGNSAQLYMVLPLDSQYCVVMTQPEPKRFLSDIDVFTEDEKQAHTILEVNKPYKMGDWTIYQYGYDNEAGRLSTYSSMELVYDPWLYPVYAGIILLSVGSICLLWSGNKRERRKMTWSEFLWFAIPAMLCWISAGALVYKFGKSWIVDGLMITGILIFAAFIIGLWIGQERPPLRTIGETRLWYSFFLATVGYFTYKHWKYNWLLSFSSVVACVFVCVNIFKPEIHSTNLMPALQSYWFVPHVTVYILSYAMLGAATIAAFIQLVNLKKDKLDNNLYNLMDNIVYIGFGFLILGMLMGAIWAKEAWGHYWSWDPKETWAFITSAGYLVYIHMRLQRQQYVRFTLWMLPVSFILLMITWIGVNYLPAAQNSVHVYSN